MQKSRKLMNTKRAAIHLESGLSVLHQVRIGRARMEAVRRDNHVHCGTVHSLSHCALRIDRTFNRHIALALEHEPVRLLHLRFPTVLTRRDRELHRDVLCLARNESELSSLHRRDHPARVNDPILTPSSRR